MPSQLFLLFVLFFLLAKAADIIIVGIREISEKLKVNLYVAGIMLGFFTSLPEMSIAWSALASRAVSVSSGNLYGGIIVLFGFILGLSLVANRNVRTDGRWRSILPITLYLALPVLLALDGVLGAIDSGILILGYFAVLSYTYLHHEPPVPTRPNHTQASETIAPELMTILAGLMGVFLAAQLIVRTTISILAFYPALPLFSVGLIVYALGTNLPEIMVSIRSWRANIRELSISNLLGSAITNGLIFGATAFVMPTPIARDAQYAVTGVAIIGILAVVTLAYHSHKNFSRIEGYALLFCYIAFLLASYLVS